MCASHCKSLAAFHRVLLSRLLRLTNHQTQLRPIRQLTKWNFKKQILPAYVAGQEGDVFNLMSNPLNYSSGVHKPV